MNRFRSQSIAIAAMLLGVMLISSGCAVSQATRQSLTSYVQAMDQVEQSADVFLTDFSSKLKVQDDLKKVAGTSIAVKRSQYPAELVLPPMANAPLLATDSALTATRQALLVVHEYNAGLVALAEGRSEQEIRQRATALGAALQPLADLANLSIPGLSQLAGVGSKILKLVQDASNRKQLQSAIEVGKPAVAIILEELEKQAPEFYRLSVVTTSQAESSLKGDIRRTAETLGNMIQRRSSPAGVDMLAAVTDIQVQLAEIGNRTGTRPAMPIPLPFKSGLPAYDTAADAEAKIFVKSMQWSADRYVELISKQNAYYELLASYVDTLRQTQRSLDLLAASLTQPVNLGEEVKRLLKVAFDLRDAMARYRTPPSAFAQP